MIIIPDKIDKFTSGVAETKIILILYSFIRSSVIPNLLNSLSIVISSSSAK